MEATATVASTHLWCPLSRTEKTTGDSWAWFARLVELGLAQLGQAELFLCVSINSLFCFSLQNKPFAIILFEQK